MTMLFTGTFRHPGWLAALPPFLFRRIASHPSCSPIPSYLDPGTIEPPILKSHSNIVARSVLACQTIVEKPDVSKLRDCFDLRGL